MEKKKSLQIFHTAGSLLEFVGQETQEKRAGDIASKLIEFAMQYNVNGNIWHHYIAYFLAFNENAFSLACEKKGLTNTSLDALAEKEMTIIKGIFDMDMQELLDCDKSETDIFAHFVSGEKNVFNAIIAGAVAHFASELEKAKTPREFLLAVADFYRDYGVGDIGLNMAFKVNKPSNSDVAELLPIKNADRKRLCDIIGYDLQKGKVVENTLAFLQGKPANNVLLYGDGGTGKSSTIKALLGEYFSQGLRVVEVYKHQFGMISDIISILKTRNYKFMLYLDDLSFEDFEIEYKYFKAIIDGGMEVRPKNMLIYATSNRRHLIKESFNDKNDMQMVGDLHRSDTLQEKLSLVARFGLSIYYPSPNQVEYLAIVGELATKNNIDMPREDLEKLALQWELRGSGKSGRTAEQFINALLAK
ncbi:MAG: ATP-binding protein [Clostridia bacterium]